MIFLFITHSDKGVPEHFKHKLQSAFEGGTPAAESEQLFTRSTRGHLKLKTFTFLSTKRIFQRKTTTYHVTCDYRPAKLQFAASKGGTPVAERVQGVIYVENFSFFMKDHNEPSVGMILSFF